MDFAAIQQCKPEMINKFPSPTSWHDGSTVPQQKVQMKRVPNLRHPALYKVIKNNALGIKHLTSRTTLSPERQRSSESFHWVTVIPRNQESRRYDAFVFYYCLGEIRLWPDPRHLTYRPSVQAVGINQMRKSLTPNLSRHRLFQMSLSISLFGREGYSQWFACSFLHPSMAF